MRRTVAAVLFSGGRVQLQRGGWSGQSSVVRSFARFGKRKPFKPSRLPQEPSSALDLCAHIVSQQGDQSYEDCREFLLENPDHVKQFERDMKKTGMTVVHSNKEISVIDTIPDFEVKHKRAAVDNLERTLHFNDTLDFIQTSVNVNVKTKMIYHNQPLNLETANYIIALSLSLVIHFANQRTPLTPSCHLNNSIKRCAILGAGGCIFPIILSSLLPREADIHAVELSEAVIQAALSFFSVEPYVNNMSEFAKFNIASSKLRMESEPNKFKLHSGCGIKWLAEEDRKKEKEKFDLLIVDIFDGDVAKIGVSDESEDKLIIGDLISTANSSPEFGSIVVPDKPDKSNLFIPSSNILNKENLTLFAESLSDEGGLLTINTVGNVDAIDDAAKWINQVLNKSPTKEHDGQPRYHVGRMKVPITLACDEKNVEKLGSRDTPFVRRDNIVLFILKNPTVAITNETLRQNLLEYVKLSDDPSRPRSSIPLPFQNEDIEPFISKWIKMYDVMDSL